MLYISVQAIFVIEGDKFIQGEVEGGEERVGGPLEGLGRSQSFVRGG